ncbi:MAG: Calx-beta domain-containing protein [Reyranellaceae bacterium]
MTTSLVNGLGGASGFGEGAMPRLDDSPSLFIDLSAVIPGGLNFFGVTYSGLYLNYNGSVTFGTALTQYSPVSITALTNIPIIAPYWADTDTRGGVTTASPGGTSTGSNLVWYDLDSAGHTFTATWDDVGYYDLNVDKVNAFQLRMIAVGTTGDFDIQFRYESINWTTGDASGGDGGLFGQVAVAGYSSGDGHNFFQLAQSGNQAAMLALPTDSNVSTPGLFTFSIRNGVPVVAQISIAATSADKVEGNSGLTLFTFTVSLTGDTSVARTVSYGVTGTGTDAATASDFENGTQPAGTVSFGVGDTTKTITVAVQGDTETEADEMFLVTLSNATGGATLGTDAAIGTIRNDDARVGITAAGADHAEGDSGSTSFTFTLMRSGDTSVAHSVSYAVAGSSAHAASAADFVDSVPLSGTVTFAAHETSKTITVSVKGDTVAEFDEEFTLTLSNASTGAAIDTPSAIGIIRNDDRSVASIAAQSASKPEGNGGPTAFTFTVSLDQAAVTDQTVVWAVAGAGTHAADGADFDGALPGGILTFGAGETSKTVSLLVSGDAIVEFDEGFSVTLSNVSPGLALGTTVAFGIIANDDKSTVSIAAAIASRPEGDSGTISYDIPIVLDQAAVTAQTVAWAVTGSGDHPADAADFNGSLPSGILTFAPGEISQIVTVTVSGDTAVEFDEGAVLTLSSPAAGLTLGTSTAFGMILNDDMSIVSIAPLSAVKPEGNDGATFYTFSISLDRPGVAAQSIDWTVAGSGAHAADSGDFGGLQPSGSVSFAAGETIQTLSIAVTGDSTIEFDESFKVTLSAPTSGLALGVATATGLIQNDDSSTVSIAAVTTALAEGNSGTTTFDFKISLSQAATGGETVAWSLSGTGAHPANAADFGNGSPGGNVTFAAGQTSATLSVSISGDTLAEFDEGFAVDLSSPSLGLTLGTSTAVATILNDDTPVVSIAPAAASKAEGNAGSTTFTFTVSLDQAATTSQSVDWSVAGVGTHAANAADFGGSLPTGSMTFVAGETSKTVSVPIAGDTAVEFDEGFVVALANASAGLAVGTASANGTILNDDKSVVSIAAAAATKSEGHAGTTAFTFTVSLDQAATTAQSVDWLVVGSGVHAADATDFGGTQPTGSVTFAAGEISKIVTVLVSGDTAVESDEGFEVALANASSALVLGAATAEATILNDDASVAVAAVAASRPEGNSGPTAFTFEVTLTGDSSVPHSVSYAVSGTGGNPAVATDFIGGAFPAGTLAFAVGETAKTIVVNVAGDTSFEPDDTFALGLSAPSTGLIIATGSTSGTILNDDASGPPQRTIVYDDAYVGLSGQPIHMSAANGVLFNDSGTDLTAILGSGPTHGTLTMAADGSFEYASTPGFAGTDSFRYLSTGAAGGEYRTVDIHIARLTPSATLDLLSLTVEQQTALAYATFFGRAPDGAGFHFWVDQFNAGLSRLGPAALFSAIADSFAISAEARNLYPFLDHAQGASDVEIGGFLDGVYNNLFNRSADAAGIAYWTGQVRATIASGRFVGSILDDIVGGARNSEAGQDITTVLGKVAVGLSYVHDQQQYHAPWTAVDDGAAATALLHAITAEPQSVLIGVVQAYNLVIASLARIDGFGEVPGTTF